MTYAISGLVQAADYNGFVSTNTPNVNAVWSTGSGNTGYGQTALATVSAGGIMKASSFLNLITTINTSASHQGTTLGSYVDSTPAAGEPIRYESNMLSNINLISTNRLNAVAQGSTSTTTATTVATWSDYLIFTFTVTFTSHDATRYFFNAGGQIGFNFSHPSAVGANIQIQDVCNDTGTVWLSSPTSGTATLAGVNYNGVTKIGGNYPAGETISANTGFYALSGTTQQLFQQNGEATYIYSGQTVYLRISASYNGSGVLTFTVLIDEVYPLYPYTPSTISAGTQANLILRPPSTTFLSNTWGSQTVISSINSV